MGTTGQSVTLANSIIGVGILAMPFCFQQCGVLLAVLMLLLSGLVSRLACYFLLKAAIIARKRNFEFLAFHVFGASGKLMVEMAIIGFLMGTCIAYFVVVGDLGPQIISKMLNINQSDILRTCVMVVVSLVCVLPLGLLRNVDSLSNVSAATIGFYFCLIIKIIAEAMSQLLAGDWRSKIELWKPEGVLQCVPIFSMALFCQTQLFEIFEALPSISLEKMTVVTKNAINMCTLVYLMVGIFGYIAFCGQHISGNILISLSETMASDVIKLGFVMSLAFSFPLIIFPCRASLYSLMYRKVVPSHHDHIINHSIPETTFRCITVAIITISLIISLLIPNIELVLGLVGSTIGVMICVVFPCACFVNVTVKNTNERLLAKIILCLGLIVMILGTYANLEAVDNESERYDSKYSQENIDKMVQNYLETNKKYVKPQDEVPIIKAPEKPVELDSKIEDSAAQPPNPVAPEQENVGNLETKDKNFVKPARQENVENVVEGAGDRENLLNSGNQNNVENKLDIINEAADDKIVEKVIQDTAANEDKLKILKQQELIETIKQHGEEQKELIKEQKQILDELEKTKQVIREKKLEDVKEQVNKIAVESIQKIANIAIQSLTGEAKDAIIAANVVENNGKKDLASELNVVQKAVENIEKIVKVVDDKVNPDLIVNKNEEVPQNKLGYLKLDEQAINDKLVDIEKKNKDLNVILKEHIHSVDEPKSYVQGEDSERNKSEQKLSPSKKEALLNNLPVPVVMSKHFEENAVKQEKLSNLLNETVTKKKKADDEVIREKREIEDVKCLEKDKKKCENKDGEHLGHESIDFKFSHKLTDPDDVKLEKINLEHQNNIIDISHQSRTLKSLNEEEPS